MKIVESELDIFLEEFTEVQGKGDSRVPNWREGGHVRFVDFLQPLSFYHDPCSLQKVRHLPTPSFYCAPALHFPKT